MASPLGLRNLFYKTQSLVNLFFYQRPHSLAVTVLCKVMKTSRSEFYDYLLRFDHNDIDHEGPLQARIKAIFREFKGRLWLAQDS